MVSASVTPIVQRMTAVGVFVCFAGMLAVPSGYSYGGAILLLVSLWFLAGRPTSFPPLQTEDRVLLWVLFAYGFVMITMVLLLGQAPKLIDKPVRAWLALPILLLLLRVPVCAAVLWGGLIVGALGAAVVTYVATQINGLYRADHASLNAIHFGNVALVFAACCAAGLLWAQTHTHKVWAWRVALLLGVVGGLYGSAMSGSRGGWVALPVIVLIFAVAGLNRRNFLRASVLAVTGSAVSLLLIFTTENRMHDRYTTAVDEIVQYQQNHAAETSVGARLEMWRAAAMHLAERPVWGWNSAVYVQSLQDLVQTGRLHPIMLEFETNVHNGYLQAWVFSGLPGLLTFLMFHGVPLWLFARHLRDSKPGARAMAVCGATLTASYACFNLTQVMFGHNNGIMFYLLALTIFWAALQHARAANGTAAD